MTNREEIVEIFSELRNFADNYIHSVVPSENWHVYSKLRDLIDQAEEDARTMLKDQDAVEPEVEVLNEIDRLYRCPRCHKCFFYEKQKYCDQCGQAVKWD